MYKHKRLERGRLYIRSPCGTCIAGRTAGNQSRTPKCQVLTGDPGNTYARISNTHTRPTTISNTHAQQDYTQTLEHTKWGFPPDSDPTNYAKLNKKHRVPFFFLNSVFFSSFLSLSLHFFWIFGSSESSSDSDVGSALGSSPVFAPYKYDATWHHEQCLPWIPHTKTPN